MNEAVKEGVIELSAESFSRREDRSLPAAPSAGNAGSLLQAIERVASNPSMEIDKIERLFAMHQQLMAKEAEAAFNGAMARAQAQIVPVMANRRNTHTNSVYADLGAIAKAIAPLYTAEGLSISFDADRPVLGADGKPLNPPPAGWFRTIAIVSHSAGHSRLHHIDLPSDETGAKGNVNKTAIQGVVSMTTYGRRCLTCMVFNVSIGDDDGNGAGAGNSGVVPDADGKAALEKCASLDSLKSAWSKLTAEQRKTLSGVMTECRKTIEKADKETA